MIWQIFAKNCIKIQKLDRGQVPSTALGSTNGFSCKLPMVSKRYIQKTVQFQETESIENPGGVVCSMRGQFSTLNIMFIYISSPMSNAAQNEISSVALLAFIMVVVNVISLKHVNAGVSETFQEVSRCRTRTQLHEGEALNPRADVTKRPKQVYQCS